MWRMKDGVIRVASGGWRVVRVHVVLSALRVARGRWLVEDGIGLPPHPQKRVVFGQLP